MRWPSQFCNAKKQPRYFSSKQSVRFGFAEQSGHPVIWQGLGPTTVKTNTTEDYRMRVVVLLLLHL